MIYYNKNINFFVIKANSNTDTFYHFMVIKCIFVVNKITKKKTLVIALRINIYSKSTKFEKKK